MKTNIDADLYWDFIVFITETFNGENVFYSEVKKHVEEEKNLCPKAFPILVDGKVIDQKDKRLRQQHSMNHGKPVHPSIDTETKLRKEYSMVENHLIDATLALL